MFEPLRKFLIVSLLVCIHCMLALAQPRDNSPFSLVGLGDFIEADLPSSHGMGGLSAVYHDFYEANLENPASLGFLQYTALQLGTQIKMSSYTRNDQTQTVWNGNMNQFSINVPIINPLNKSLERQETTFAWGTSVSFRPYSQVGYDVQITDELDTIGLVQRNFMGSGGLYQISWTNGWKYKNFSLGLNLGLLSGKQTFEEDTYFQELENVYNDFFETNISYKGFNYRVGLMYEHPLDLNEAREKGDKPSRLLSAGLYYNSDANLDTKSDEILFSINELINDVDTAKYELDAPGKAIVPGTLGVGLLYHHAGDFRIGVDYRTASWSNYTNEARPEVMLDAYRIGGGIGWIPDAGNISSYWQRVEYRVGFYTKTDPRVIEGEQVREAAFSIGALLPFVQQRNISWLQVGLDFGKRTGGENLKDSFMRIGIGLVFNDNSWFIRGKYD